MVRIALIHGYHGTMVRIGNESIELGNESIQLGTMLSLVPWLGYSCLFVSHFVHFYTLEYFRPFLPEFLSVVSIVPFLGPYLVTKQ